MTSPFETVVEKNRALTRQNASIASSTVKAEGAVGGADVGGAVTSDQFAQFAGSGGAKAKRNYQHFRSWVFVCISAIARRLSGQPIRVGKITGAEANPERGGRGGQRMTKKIHPRDRARMPNSFKTLEGQELEVFAQHEVLDLLVNPNPAQDKHAFFFQTVTNYYMTGISYWVLGVSQEGEPEVWAVPTHWIQPKHEGGLFTSYVLKVSEMSEPISLEPEQVGRYYFPDPSDLKCAIAPVDTQLKAIKTDEKIQAAQESSFDHGIFPSVVLKVGKNIGPDGKELASMPVLTPSQRRSITSGVRKVWAGVANFNKPAIIDGLISGIEKLQSTPREMDFERSGEIVKKRIFQMFGLNPITVGEVTAANRAQATEAEKNLANGVINPLADGLSTVLTSFLGPKFDTSERLAIWIEEHTPVDPDLDLKRWTIGRQNKDVTRDEYRAHVLNLPPMDDEQAAEVDESDEEDEVEDEVDDGEDIDADEEEGKQAQLTSKSVGQLTREGIKELHVKQTGRAEEEVERALSRFF